MEKTLKVKNEIMAEILGVSLDAEPVGEIEKLDNVLYLWRKQGSRSSDLPGMCLGIGYVFAEICLRHIDGTFWEGDYICFRHSSWRINPFNKPCKILDKGDSSLGALFVYTKGIASGGIDRQAEGMRPGESRKVAVSPSEVVEVVGVE